MKLAKPEISSPDGQRALVAYEDDRWLCRVVEFRLDAKIDFEREASYWWFNEGVVVLQETIFPDTYCMLLCMQATEGTEKPAEDTETSSQEAEEPVYVLLGSQPSLNGTGREWFSIVFEEPPGKQDTYSTLFKRYARRPETCFGDAISSSEDEEEGSFHGSLYSRSSFPEQIPSITFPPWSARAHALLRGVPLVQAPYDEAVRAPE